jgi:uncharacterized protein YmfQ (DUF2313 family)
VLNDKLKNAGHPNVMRARIERITGKQVQIIDYENFREGMALAADKMPEEYWGYVFLLKYFPRCLDAVLAGEEMPTGATLLLAVRQYGCSHVLACLYDELQPYATDVQNDAVLDHVRLWTSKTCPLCA